MKKRNQSNNPKFPNYWIQLGYSEEEANDKCIYSRRVGSVLCVEYWIKRGHSEEFAKEEISRRQSVTSKKQKTRKRTPSECARMSEFQKYLNTLDYWVDKYGDEIGLIKFNKFNLDRIENGKNSKQHRLKKNPNTYIESSVRRVEYWIKRGYSEQDARIMVARVQSRGVDFYIKKYGEIEGLRKWKERNEKWFNSFYNSGNDLEAINEKRKLNAHVGYYSKESISNIKNLNFYIIILKDDNGTMIAKYGLTKQDTIAKRWSVSLNYNLFLFLNLEAIQAVELEQKFHNIFRKSYTPNIIKTTECFEYNNTNLMKTLEILEEYKQ